MRNVIDRNNVRVLGTGSRPMLHAQLPSSTLRVMKANGHCPHMSHPDETIALMKEHLAAAVAAR